MYLYEISKLSQNTVEDRIKLIELLENEEVVHCMLGRIFGVDTEENWRSKYNILYRKLPMPCTWIIQSDIPINDKCAKEEGIKVTKKNILPLGRKCVINLTVSPYCKQKSQNRVKIKTEEDRISWIKSKLSDGQACRIISCNENNMVQFYMAHKDESKGSLMLNGYDYSLEIEVLDNNAFNEIVKTGVGPSKAYGFGMVSIA